MCQIPRQKFNIKRMGFSTSRVRLMDCERLVYFCRRKIFIVQHSSHRCLGVFSHMTDPWNLCSRKIFLFSVPVNGSGSSSHIRLMDFERFQEIRSAGSLFVEMCRSPLISKHSRLSNNSIIAWVFFQLVTGIRLSTSWVIDLSHTRWSLSVQPTLLNFLHLFYENDEDR